MQKTSERIAHERLVSRMADRQGLDLQELSLRGVFPEADFEEAIVRCTGCTRPDCCETWLETAPPGAGAVETPDYCRNTALFADLKAR